MGTTSQKLTYLNDTKKELKQKINNLGGDITDQTTFRQYAEQLQNVYDILPKTAYEEGSNITLSNTLKGKIDFEKIYQEVEYIESSGPQYIDTGVLPNTNTKIDIEFETIAKGDNGIIFGGEDTYNNNAFHLYNTSTRFDIGFESAYTAETIIYNLNTKYHFVMDKTGFTLNSTTGIFGTNTISTTYSIYLFALHRATNVIDSNAQKRIYYCKLYDNGTLVRDLIPCYRKLDNVIGLYDKVEDKFYTNAGTGTFTKGEDVGNGFGDIVGYGQTEQKSYEGYNILNFNSNVVLEDNILSTDKGAGQVLASDIQLQANTTYYFKFILLEKPFASTTITSYIDGTPDYTIAQSNIQGYSIGTLITKQIAPTSNCILSMAIWGNANAETIKFQYWVTTDNTKNTYEPYVGNSPSPNPSYPQDIEVVRGKNRLKFKANNTQTSNGITATTNISSITLNGTSNAQVNIACEIEPIKVKGTYKLSGYTRDDNYVDLYYKDSGGTIKLVHCKNTPTITFNEGDTLFEVFIYVADGTTATFNNETFNLQLEKGTEVTSYLPYNTLEVVERGINYANYSLLFNNTDCYSISNDNISLLQNDSRATTLIDGTTWGISLKKGTYTLYTSGTGISPQIQIIGKAIGQITRVNYNQLVTFELSQDDIVAIKYLNTSTFPINLGKVMIIKGTITNTPTYEPYQTPQTYQLSLGEYEFAKIGNYVDTIEYDVENDKVYKKEKCLSKKITNFVKSVTGVANKYRWSASNLGTSLKCDLTTGTMAYMNIGKILAEGYTYLPNEGFTINNNTLIMYFDKFSEYTQAEMDSYVLQNDIIAVFPLGTSEQTLTEITDPTLKQQVKNWYYAKSNTGTTIIEIDGQLPLIIKVRALKGE